MIRCISELGLILLLNIKNTIYVAGLFHCGFMNHQFNKNIDQYMPYYHEYMSVSDATEKKIINLELEIYPHMKFMNIWNQFVKHKNEHKLSNNLTEILNNKLLITNKSIFIKFKNQLTTLITLLEKNNKNDDILQSNDILVLVHKINNNLKNMIYSKSTRII
jgi:hypothetical protein